MGLKFLKIKQMEDDGENEGGEPQGTQIQHT